MRHARALFSSSSSRSSTPASGGSLVPTAAQPLAGLVFFPAAALHAARSTSPHPTPPDLTPPHFNRPHPSRPAPAHPTTAAAAAAASAAGNALWRDIVDLFQNKPSLWRVIDNILQTQAQLLAGPSQRMHSTPHSTRLHIRQLLAGKRRERIRQDIDDLLHTSQLLAGHC